jgi:hypothetical protein
LQNLLHKFPFSLARVEFDVPNPTGMRCERIRSRNIIKSSVRNRASLLHDFADFDVCRRVDRRNSRPLILHRARDCRKLLLIEPHQANRNKVNAHRICPGNHSAKLHVRRRERSLSLSGQNAVDDRKNRADGLPRNAPLGPTCRNA